MVKPKIIGICGFPRHGKTTVQRFLTRIGVAMIDDSASLRRLAMEKYNLTWSDVSTQIGKSLKIYRTEHDDVVTIRQALGDLGAKYEKEHGQNYWIDAAISPLASGQPVSFGSVRMGQSRAIKEAGGFVIAVVDPRQPPSTFAFDQYDMTYVDAVVSNDSDLWALERRAVETCSHYLDFDFFTYWKDRQQDELATSTMDGK